MIINEFLPNPVGKDQDGEWIELFNDGVSAVNLSNWQIKDASGKSFVFSEEKYKLFSGEYLVLDYKTTKISLNNDKDDLLLLDNGGRLIDEAHYLIAAKEGKSFIREGGEFVLTDTPTPGAINVLKNVPKQVKKNTSASVQEVVEKVSNNDGAVVSGRVINNPSYVEIVLASFFVCSALTILFFIISKKLKLFTQ